MESYQTDLVSPNIKRYIDDKIRCLIGNPKYLLDIGSLTKSNNHREANRHSVNIEMVNFCLTNLDCLRIKREEKKRCQKQLAEARQWAYQNYSSPLEIEYIEETGKRVDPDENPQGFRRDNVKITGARVPPPAYEKVTRELNIFLWENRSISNPLEQALHAHFNIARIHPFKDGNGRASRLVQDAMLYRAHLPLPVITVPEKSEYILKIEAAAYTHKEKEAQLDPKTLDKLKRANSLASTVTLTKAEQEEGEEIAKELLKKRMSPEQNYFYDFLALKILDGLTEEVKRLYPSDREMRDYLKKRITS